MSHRDARARRRARERRRLAFPLAIGAALALMAIAGYFMLRPSFMTGEQLPPGTSNYRGPAEASVEVEEWSDFQ